MPKRVPAKQTTSDPFKRVADALDSAVKAAKEGAYDAKASAGEALPAVGRFMSRLVYTTSYTFSYGVVFPAVLIAKSIPPDNAIVHGFADGARAASDKVERLRHPRAEAAAKPRLSRSRSLNGTGKAPR
jgi:hypothetical protein